MKTYSPDDLRRMREAAVVIVGANGDGSQERQMLIEETVQSAVRAGRSVAELERQADAEAREEGKFFLQDLRAGRTAMWADPGYLAWIEKRKLKMEGLA